MKRMGKGIAIEEGAAWLLVNQNSRRTEKERRDETVAATVFTLNYLYVQKTMQKGQKRGAAV